MEAIVIHMKRAKSTKRFDVYEAIRPDAYINSVYVNKAASAGEEITLTVEDKP